MGILNLIRNLYPNNNTTEEKPTNYYLEEYKHQITELNIQLNELKNKEILYLKQIDDLINDKNDIRDKVKTQLQELQLKESELNRQRETILELKPYKDKATEKITNQLIFTDLDNLDNKIVNEMLKVKRTYVARELEKKLNISRSAIWQHLKNLEKKEYIEIHGEKKSKFFILTDKYKDSLTIEL